jgi:hypothetical protein
MRATSPYEIVFEFEIQTYLTMTVSNQNYLPKLSLFSCNYQHLQGRNVVERQNSGFSFQQDKRES